MALKLNLILLFCAIGCTLAADNDTTTTSTTSTTPPSTTTPTTTTTASSSTTTTTTSSSSSTTTTSTTAAPVTTTTAAPPLPPPEVGEWSSSCIKVKFAAQLRFSYDTRENKTKQVEYNLPVTSINKTDDDCGHFAESQSIVLHWVDEKTKEENSFALRFDRNGSTVSLAQIKIDLQAATLFHDAKNETITLLFNKNSTFVTPEHMSYHCTREQTLGLKETILTKDIIGNITFSNVQFEAFHPKDEKSSDTWSFSSAKDCDANSTPDIVPIAVGIALSALILIVFISYLVARRRSTNRGYMSF